MRALFTAIIATLVLGGCAAHADSAPAGAPEVVTKPGGCATCHGANGVSTGPTFPNLAGQQRSYLEHVLHAYKDGERKNPVMSMQAANLSDADIKAAAAWFAQQPAKVYLPDADKK